MKMFLIKRKGEKTECEKSSKFLKMIESCRSIHFEEGHKFAMILLVRLRLQIFLILLKLKTNIYLCFINIFSILRLLESLVPRYQSLYIVECRKHGSNKILNIIKERKRDV